MITGLMLRDAMISGANNVANHKKEVDELNVFPVPDGDTGTNMSMTIQNGAKELKKVGDNATVGEVAQVAASALLRGARGNSGVILSLLFRGFSKGLKDKKEATGKDLAEALAGGVEAAYKAVMKPTEGTILTVARIAAEQAAEKAKETDDAFTVWNTVMEAAEEALASTPDLLPVLKKAGVVDAGGKGLCLIFEGMGRVFAGEKIVEWDKSSKPTPGAEPTVTPGHNAAGSEEVDIEFAYCTEFIVDRINERDPLSMRAYLQTIGDCVVVVDDEEIIKTHVHTNDPGKALQEALKYGPLSAIKIENMRDQHTSKVLEVKQSKENNTYVPVDPEMKYGFVGVCAGAGLKSLFHDLGCNQVVSGGQTMNPSTDDILSAVQSVPAQTVFVLPNNKNIIMAAEQAIPLADRRVVVLPTVTIPQGISAMLAFDPDGGELENQLAMTEAFGKVESGQITFAARDSDYEGHKIKKGELLALANNKLAFVDTNLEKTVLRLTKTLVKKSTGFVTLIYGADVIESDAQKVYNALRAKLNNDIELTLVAGGQPVYYYLISAE